MSKIMQPVPLTYYDSTAAAASSSASASLNLQSSVFSITDKLKAQLACSLLLSPAVSSLLSPLCCSQLLLAHLTELSG